MTVVNPPVSGKAVQGTLAGVLDDSSNPITGLRVLPLSDTDNAIIVQRPDALYGDAQVYGQAQAFLLIKEGTGSVHNALVLARIDGKTGAIGSAGGFHAAAGLNADADFNPTQNIWVQNFKDVVGIVMTAVAGQTQDLARFMDSAGATTLFKVGADGAISSNKSPGTDYQPKYLQTAAGSQTPSGGANQLAYGAISVPVGGAALTGIKYCVGATASGNVIVALYDAAGNRVAQSASTAQGATNAVQAVPFTAPVTLTQGRYFVAMIFSSATATAFMGAPIGPSKIVGQGGFSAPASTAVPGATEIAIQLPIMTAY